MNPPSFSLHLLVESTLLRADSVGMCVDWVALVRHRSLSGIALFATVAWYALAPIAPVGCRIKTLTARSCEIKSF